MNQEDKAQLDLELMMITELRIHLHYLIKTKQCSKFMDFKRQCKKDQNVKQNM